MLIIPPGRLTEQGLWEAGRASPVVLDSYELTGWFSSHHRCRRPGIVADGDQGCAGFAAVARAAAAALVRTSWVIVIFGEAVSLER
jgi:hypothetical protein